MPYLKSPWEMFPLPQGAWNHLEILRHSTQTHFSSAISYHLSRVPCSWEQSKRWNESFCFLCAGHVHHLHDQNSPSFPLGGRTGRLLTPVSFWLPSISFSLPAVHLLSLMKVTASQSHLAYFPWRGRAAHHCQSNAQTFSLQSRHEVSGEWRLSGLPAHLPSPTNPGALHQRQQRKNEWAKWLPWEQSDLSVFWNSFIPPI